jgi:type I restriction enzyme S subunit
MNPGDSEPSDSAISDPYPDPLPSGWVELLLTELVGPTGLMCDGDWVETKDQNPSGEVRLIQLADIGDGIFRDKSNRFLTQQTAHALNCTYLQKDDVLISRMAAPLGRACLMPSVSQPCVTAVDVCIVRPDDAAIHPRWIMNAINSPAVRRRIAAQASGTTRTRISSQKLRKLLMRLPPAGEQERIVAKLDELFSDIEAGEKALERAQALLRRYRQSVLKAAVTGELTREWREKNLPRLKAERKTGADLLADILKKRREAWEAAELAKMHANGKEPRDDKWKAHYKEPLAPETSGLPKLPVGWAWASMDQLLTGIEAGKSFRCEERPPGEGEVGIVKVSAVTWGIFDEHESKTVTDHNLIDYRHLIRSGDFLFSRANTLELVGACLIVGPITKTLLLSDKILRLTFALEQPRWMDLVLKSFLGRKQIETLATGNQHSMRNISQESLRQIAMPLPPEQELTRIIPLFDDEWSRSAHSEASTRSELCRSVALRQTILSQAFSGKLVPQNPNDEPASELLVRIRMERESASEINRRKRKPKGAVSIGSAKQVELVD